MQVRSEKNIRLSDELSLIPAWAWSLAALAFGGMQYLLDVFVAHQPDAPPWWARVLLGLVAGTLLGCYFLLIGYVNRDAGRRGMSRLLWTLVAILIPNGLGIILYFVLRQPRLSLCPQCGNAVQSGFNFCPQCNRKLHSSCPQCQHAVGDNDTYCPYCGVALGKPDVPAPRQQSEMRG